MSKTPLLAFQLATGKLENWVEKGDLHVLVTNSNPRFPVRDNLLAVKTEHAI